MGEFDDWEELGPPEIRPVPGDRSRSRTIAIVAAVAGAVVVLAGVVALLVLGAGAGGPTETARRAPSDTVTESFTVTASPTATSTTVESTSPGSPAVSTLPQFTRAAKVVYRQDGALWVAEESGGGPVKIVTAGSGAFSLSPDGNTIAFVDGGAKTLALVDVATARLTTVGPADVRAPVWSPSSQWLAFSKGGEVYRVQADGRQFRNLGKGTAVAIGPDGAAYAYGAGGAITYVDASGHSTKIAITGQLNGLALGTDHVFYAVGGTSRPAMSLRSVSTAGSGDQQLAGVPDDTKAYMYDEVALSPDGKWLAFASVGDTGHSRLFTVAADGTRKTPLSLRRDDYLLRWSSDGSRLLFIDGNAEQGETTQLMSVRPDGTSRLTLLKDAGI